MNWHSSSEDIGYPGKHDMVKLKCTSSKGFGSVIASETFAQPSLTYKASLGAECLYVPDETEASSDPESIKP